MITLLPSLTTLPKRVAAGGQQIASSFRSRWRRLRSRIEHGIARPRADRSAHSSEFLGIAHAAAPRDSGVRVPWQSWHSISTWARVVPKILPSPCISMRGMAVLAQHAALGVFGARGDLVMQVVGDEQVLLGVQLRLFIAVGIVGRAVGEFHQPLVGHADTLAAVVAGVAGLDRNARVLEVVATLTLASRVPWMLCTSKWPCSSLLMVGSPPS